MKKIEYSTSISAAMDDFKKFLKSQLEELKVERQKLLAQTKKDLKELATQDSSKNPTRNEAECMQMTKEEQMQKSIQSGAGSTMDAVDAMSKDIEINMEAKQDRDELISSNDEGKNEKIQDAELE